MMNILHWSPRSPYVRKAMVALHEKGLIGETRIVRTAADPLIPHEGLMKINPLSKIPTLEREGADPIFDSRVIMEWADVTGVTGPQLFPAEPEARWRTLSFEAVGNGLLDVALPWLVEQRMRPEDMRYPVQLASYRRKLDSVADWLEARVSELSGRPFDAGHIAIAVALSYLDFRFAAENWQGNRPALAAWHDGIKARPSMQATEFHDDPRPAG